MLQVTLPNASGVHLWWPLGLGAQAVYNVTASFSPSGLPSAAAITSRPLGFRTAYLVTANDSDPSLLAGVNGNDDFTMRFKVGGWDRILCLNASPANPHPHFWYR